MAKSNLQYWADRQEAVLDAVANQTEEEINKKLDKYYMSAMKQIFNDFEAVYNALMTQLENGEQPTVAKLYQLDKYWQMQAKLKVLCENLGNKEATLLSKKFEEEWERVYEDAALPSVKEFAKISESNAKAMVNSPWLPDGKIFSTRVWQSTENLINALNDDFIHLVTTGKDTLELRNKLMKMVNDNIQNKRAAANRLIRTEVCHIQTAAAEKRYKDDGLEEYVFLGREEHELNCDCKKLNGKVFRFDDPKAPRPPRHPNCRCRIAPVPKSDILRRRMEESLKIEQEKKAKKIEADELRKQAKELRAKASALKKEGKTEQAKQLEAQARTLEKRYKEIYASLS